jgi:hypothetical protein
MMRKDVEFESAISAILIDLSVNSIWLIIDIGLKN